VWARTRPSRTHANPNGAPVTGWRAVDTHSVKVGDLVQRCGDVAAEAQWRTLAQIRLWLRTSVRNSQTVYATSGTSGGGNASLNALLWQAVPRGGCHWGTAAPPMPELMRRLRNSLQTRLGGPTSANIVGAPGSIQLRNVTAGYGGAPVLTAFDLHINPGEFVYIVGPS